MSLSLKFGMWREGFMVAEDLQALCIDSESVRVTRVGGLSWDGGVGLTRQRQG